MRHIGQELALGPVGVLRLYRHQVGLFDRILKFRTQGKCLFFGLFEYFFSALAFSNIDVVLNDPDDLTFRIPEGGGGDDTGDIPAARRVFDGFGSYLFFSLDNPVEQALGGFAGWPRAEIIAFAADNFIGRSVEHGREGLIDTGDCKIQVDLAKRCGGIEYLL